jgi:general secretion pathway protein K
MRRYKQQGTAIVTALLIMVLVAMIVTLLLQQTRDATRRTEQMVTLSRLFAYGHGAEAWAAATILNEAKNYKNKPYTISSDTWILPPTEIDGVTVSGKLIDAQSRFNVNNLAHDDDTQSWQKALQNLLTSVPATPPITGSDATLISQQLSEWLALSGGPSDLDYQQQFGYGIAHAPMASVSEFRLLAGVTPQIYNAASPYLVALPDSQIVKVNVNTAAPETLAAVTGLSMAEMTALTGNRPFNKVNDFMQRIDDHFKDQDMRNKVTNKISVESHYFLLQTYLLIDDHHYTLTSVLHQNVNTVTVLARSRGLI